MKYIKNIPASFVRFVLVLAGLFIALNSASTIYTNHKTNAGYYGQGSIWLKEDCTQQNQQTKKYECRGLYHQGSGMVSFNDATVRVDKPHVKGEIIGDVYRDLSVNVSAPDSQQQYITGQQRRSIANNLLRIILVVFGIGLIIIGLLPKKLFDNIRNKH